MTDLVPSKNQQTAAAKASPIPAGAVKIDGLQNITRSPLHDGLTDLEGTSQFLVIGAKGGGYGLSYDVLSRYYYPTMVDVRDRLTVSYGWKTVHLISLPASETSPWQYYESYISPFTQSPWASLPVFMNNLERWIESFPVPSKKVPGLVAYFQDTDKRARNIQTPIKPGKYLKKFFGDILSEEEIQELAMAWSNQYSPRELKVTQDADEIERIYRGKYNGSCMHFRHSEYLGDEHPARVYAGPDLAIAYIGDINSVDARCLVWPSKKIFFPKFYGDYFRMESSLISAGWKEGDESDFNGARIQRLPYDEGFILPYLDTHEYVRDNGEYLIFDDNGDIGARNTNGLSDDISRCDDCEDPVHSDNLTHIGSLDRNVCSCCRDQSYFYCDEMDDYYRDEDGVSVEGMGTYSQRGVDRMVNRGLVFFCEESEEYFSSSHDCTELTDGRTVELSVAERKGYFCAFSDQYSLDHESKQELSDGRYVDMDMVSNSAELDAWCDREGVTLVGPLKDDNQIELDLAA